MSNLLSRCQQLFHPDFFNQIGELIDYGIDGGVYYFGDNVIKISENYTYSYFVEKSLYYLLNNDCYPYAKLYEYGFSNDLFYYITEKLNSLSKDEYKVFHTIVSHEDKNLVKNYTLDKVAEMLQGLARGLDFDAERIISFYEALQNSPIRHLDLHPRNILKDNSGNFKLIDFNRIEIGDFNGKDFGFTFT